MKALILLALFVCTASGQTPPPASHVKLSADATRYLDSLANDARTTRLENAACLTSYSISDSTLTIERFSQANYSHADSVTIYVDSASAVPVCPRGAPLLHSHVALGGAFPPSEIDRHTAQVRGVWGLLLQVLENGYLLRIY